MSSRAIRKLRQDAAALQPTASDDESEDDSDTPATPKRKSVFTTILDNSSSDESSVEKVDETAATIATDEKVRPQLKPHHSKQMKELNDEQKVVQEEEEDIDALLTEFQHRDVACADDKQKLSEETESASTSENVFSIFLQGLDPRHLDIEASMRNSLLGGNRSNADQNSALPFRHTKRNRRYLFGTAREGWVRPPHLVGGGIGMLSYTDMPYLLHIPWPYTADCHHRWVTFVFSEQVRRDAHDFYSVIHESGDLNALCYFVIHHPYATDALLQLSSILYQTNRSHEGLLLLRRCLWVYESAALLTFMRDETTATRMNVDQPENTAFFKALMKLVQISNIAGLPKSAMAILRYTLSLDPLRDPMGALLILDNCCLASNTDSADRWLVDLVESGMIRIWYKDPIRADSQFACGLLDLPNWSFSYALALFQLSEDDASLKPNANAFMQRAIRHFPSIVDELLQANDIDTVGQSVRRNWMKVLDFDQDRSRTLKLEWRSNAIDAVEHSATMQTLESIIIRIFVRRNARLWAGDNVLQFVYDNLERVQTETWHDQIKPPSPAIMRYSDINPADFEDEIQQLPPDVAMIDPNLLAHAMNIDPNRRRLLGGQQNQANEEQWLDQAGNQPPQPRVLGGPPHIEVDPDWPLLEVFWRR
jgi:hypothetical protein